MPQIIVNEGTKEHTNNSNIDGINKQIPLDRLNTLPGLGSSMDLTRYLQFIPGVSSGSDGFGGIHVRGGGSDQNLFLLDGIPVYNPFHMLGASSIFNAAALQQVSLSKNYFHAGQGDRLSSALDIRMRDGHREKTTLSAGLSVLGSHAVLEMPFSRNKAPLCCPGQISHAGELIRHYSNRLKESRISMATFIQKSRIFMPRHFWRLISQIKLFSIFTRAMINSPKRKLMDLRPTPVMPRIVEINISGETQLVACAGYIAFGSNIYAKTSVYFSTYNYQSLNASL